MKFTLSWLKAHLDTDASLTVVGKQQLRPLWQHKQPVGAWLEHLQTATCAVVYSRADALPCSTRCISHDLHPSRRIP